MKNLKFSDLYYLIIDDDKKLFNCFIPTFSTLIWDKVIVNEIDKGRKIHVLTYEINKTVDPKAHFNSLGYQFTDELLVDMPKDESMMFKGKLPQYAANADRYKIVIINCHCRGKYGEMEIDFPGRDKLVNTNLGDYKAKCCKCGKTVLDCYNWYR